MLGRYPNLLMTREQILEIVWAGRVVEDAAITNCIWQIRKAIGQRGREVLRTRVERGYAYRCTARFFIACRAIVAAEEEFASMQLFEIASKKNQAGLR